MVFIGDFIVIVFILIHVITIITVMVLILFRFIHFCFVFGSKEMIYRNRIMSPPM